MMIMMAFPVRGVNATNYPYCYHVTRSPDNRRRRGFHCEIVATNAAQKPANISIMTPLKAIGTGREFKMSRVHFFVSVRAGRKSRPNEEGPVGVGFLGYKNLALFPRWGAVRQRLAVASSLNSTTSTEVIEVPFA